jgi:hypothetical protein
MTARKSGFQPSIYDNPALNAKRRAEAEERRSAAKAASAEKLRRENERRAAEGKPPRKPRSGGRNGGRPAGQNQPRAKRFLTASLIAALDKKIRNSKDPSSAADRMIQRLLEFVDTAEPPHALKAMGEIFDRVEGKPTQAIELTGADKGPVEQITREMTPAEAAAAYRRTLEEEQ